MSCTVGEVTERLEKELCSFSNLSVTLPTSQHILQPFRRFTYVTAHSPTLPLLHLRHSSFSNPSFASPTSQALHFRHLASRPWPQFPLKCWIRLCDHVCKITTLFKLGKVMERDVGVDERSHDCILERSQFAREVERRWLPTVAGRVSNFPHLDPSQLCRNSLASG